MFPLTNSQKDALAELQKRGIENRIAWLILRTGCFTFEEFCAKHTTQEMLRIPNFGPTALRKVMTFAVRENIEVRDTRLPVTPRMRAAAHPARQKWEYAVFDLDERYSAFEICNILNSSGGLGWEAFGSFHGAVFMKRPML